MTWQSAFGPHFARDWDPFRALDRAQAGLDAVRGQANDSYAPGFPAVDVWTNETGLVIRAELPGVDPDQLDISVVGDTLRLAGSRPADSLAEGETWLRHERGHGSFERTIRLPFKVEADAVAATFRHGVLEVTVPKAGAEQARKIEVQIH
jgi:HSP20 family protein